MSPVVQGGLMKRILFSVFLSTLLTSCGKDSSKGSSTQSSGVAILSISNAPKYDFGLQPVDSITEKEFTITNLGVGIATEVTGDFYLSLSFGYKGGAFPGEGGTCTATLASQSTCTVIVVFSPKSSGPAESTLIINYNNGAASTTTNGPTLTGHGI